MEATQRKPTPTTSFGKRTGADASFARPSSKPCSTSHLARSPSTLPHSALVRVDPMWPCFGCRASRAKCKCVCVLEHARHPVRCLPLSPSMHTRQRASLESIPLTLPHDRLTLPHDRLTSCTHARTCHTQVKAVFPAPAAHVCLPVAFPTVGRVRTLSWSMCSPPTAQR